MCGDDLRSPANKFGSVHLPPPRRSDAQQRERTTSEVQQQSPRRIEGECAVCSIARLDRSANEVEAKAVDGARDLDIHPGPREIGAPRRPGTKRRSRGADAPVAAMQSWRDGRPCTLLRHRDDAARDPSTERVLDAHRRKIGETLLQFGSALVAVKFHTVDAKDGAGIEARIHDDGTNARFTISTDDCGRNRTRAAMSWKERWMQVQDAMAWRRQERRGNDLSKVGEEANVGVQRRNRGRSRLITNPFDFE